MTQATEGQRPAGSARPTWGDAAAAASMARLAGGDGIAPGGTGVDLAPIDSGVVPVGGLAQPGRVIHGPAFSSERRNRRLATLDTFGHGTHADRSTAR